jgi:hypothetical protein
LIFLINCDNTEAATDFALLVIFGSFKIFDANVAILVPDAKLINLPIFYLPTLKV